MKASIIKSLSYTDPSFSIIFLTLKEVWKNGQANSVLCASKLFPSSFVLCHGDYLATVNDLTQMRLVSFTQPKDAYVLASPAPAEKYIHYMAETLFFGTVSVKKGCLVEVGSSIVKKDVVLHKLYALQPSVFTCLGQLATRYSKP